MRLMILLHLFLSNARWTDSGSVQLHQSIISLEHLLAGFLREQLPSTIPSITSSLVIHLSSSRHAQFPASASSAILNLLSSLYLISNIMLVILSLQHTFNLLLIASHLKCQTFSGSGVGYFCSPCLSSIEQTAKTHEKHIILVFDGYCYYTMSFINLFFTC